MNALTRTAALAMASLVAAPLLAELQSKTVIHDSAPPIPPPIRTRTAPPDDARWRAAATVYSIGDPTPEEQLYVEMINRARADAFTEALLFYNTTDPAILSAYNQYEVDLELMLTEFGGLPPAQPLAINPLLTEAARRHTQDMFDNVFQAHQGTDGTMPWDRVDDTGYNWSTVGENIYARAKSVFHGHTGFEVDWGPGLGGMQDGRGHRVSIHNEEFREIGVGVILGTNEDPPEPPVGPQLVTQAFATAQGSTPFITGVVYYDLNGNSFYDLGEGIGGVTIEASGTATQAVSARSGGYALPVTGDGTYTVTFSDGGFAPDDQTVSVVSSENVKVDFTPDYHEPAIAGSPTPAIARPNTYTFAAVAGAAEHEWRSFQKLTPPSEGAENGTAQVTIDQSSGYAAISSSFTVTGSFAFHLLHPDPPAPQSITLNPAYLVGDNGALQFQSRLGYATGDEHAQVQVSINDGVSWEVVHTQGGDGGPGESAFSQKTVDLSAYVGKTVRLRFVYDWQNGNYFPHLDPIVGWWIDDIQFTDVSQLANVTLATTGESSFQFEPTALGEYGLQVRARTGHEFLPWGPIYSVQAVEGGDEPEFRIATAQRVGADLHLQLEVTAGTLLPSEIVVEAASSVEGSWSGIEASIDNGLLVVIPISGSPAQFFRVSTH